MRHLQTALVMSAIAVLYFLNHREHQQTRQKLDELIANSNKPETPVAPVAGQVPLELTHATASPYIIEAPDMLKIEAVVQDSKMKTTARLPIQPISGSFQVRPDGTVGLGHWGSVPVVGKTVEEATSIVQKHLAKTDTWKSEATGSPVVVVSLLQCNSKRYFVVVNTVAGEQVFSFACTGKETVLTAVADCSGLEKANSMYVKRKQGAKHQTLPVDWDGIIHQDNTTTNYQLFNGDRLYVTLAK